jgi:hypothetical protein
MPPPLAKKLQNQQPSILPEGPQANIKTYAPGEPIKIRPITCYNDVVALLRFRVQMSISLEMVGDSQYKSEGIVVGVGPGLLTMEGSRSGSQCRVGDVVSFYGNPITAVEPSAGIYKGQQIIMITERSLLCKLPSVPFEEVSGE